MEKVKKSHLELGKAHFAKGMECTDVLFKDNSEFNKAISEFNKVELNILSDDAYYCDEDCDEDSGNIELAEVYLWLGRTYHELFDYKKAITYYTKSIAEGTGYSRNMEPKTWLIRFFAKVYFYSGIAHNEDDAILEAIEFYTLSINCYKRILSTSSDQNILNDQRSLAEVYLKKGDSHSALKEHRDAIVNYTEAITTYKLNAEFTKELSHIYLARGLVYFDIKQYKEAISDYSEAIDLPNKDITKWTDFLVKMKFDELVYIYSAPEHVGGGAYNYTHRIIDVSILNVICYNSRGECYFQLKEYALAIDDFTKVIYYANNQEPEFQTNGAKAYLRRAESHRALGDAKAAICDYRSEIFMWTEFPDEIPLDGYLRIGELLIKGNKYKAAMASFKKYTGKLIEVLGSCPRPKGASKLKLRKEVLYSFVEKDKFLTDTLEGIDKNVNLYKDIYIQSLELVEILHVKDLSSNNLHKQPEPEVAHYTTKIASEKMLFKKDHKEASPIRLASVATSNDPQEGLSLLACLGLSNDNIESDHEAFITCFTFNHDCLNQFRLYGKENNKEATGISLVIDRDYFKSYLDELPASAKIKSKEKKISEVIESKGDLSNLEQEIINLKQEVVNLKQTLTPKQDPPRVPDKLSLYRCVYIDPETGQVVSVGHRESYTFYRESPTWERDKVKKYEDEIAEIVEKFSVGFDKLKKEVDELKKKIAKENKETQIVYEGILSKLLLHLRYLVKHVAFKEEQECRMITVEPLVRNPKIIVEDDKRMFIEHLPLATSVRHVYFAPNAPGYKLFQDRIKFEGLQFDCRISKSPLAKE